MKHFFTLLAIALTSTLFAQLEQISVGAGYAYQAYYNISTGEVTQIENEAWDLAFATGPTDGGVLINESASFSGVPIEAYLAPISEWEEAIDSDTIFKEEIRLYNGELSWKEGALNKIKEDENSDFDYGWGAYNPSNHMISGNKYFVLKMRDGAFKKFEVMSLSGGVYNIRIADLDGSNEVSYAVSKSDGGEGAALVHFSLNTGNVVDLPTDYDLVFGRYTTPLDVGDGTFIEYSVTGVLSAPGVEVAVANGIDPLTVLESDYTDAYTDLPTAIGHDWKAYDFTLGWVLPEDRAYFVKAKNGEIYKFVFYDFEGSSTGTSTIEKTFIGTTSVLSNKAPQLEIDVYPNPATDQITIDVANNTQFDVLLYDMTGRQVLSRKMSNKETLDLNNITQTGMYALQVMSQGAVSIRLINIER